MYIFVYLPTDEATLLPRGSSWIENESIQRYQTAVEQALLERWPDGVEVDVTTYAQSLHVDTDVPDCDEEVVGAVLEKVWATFDWLVTAD